MIAVVQDEADVWCDMQGRPVRKTTRKRRHSMDGTFGNRFKRIAQLLFRFGILAFTFLYCIGSQFLTLRRLTVAEMAETNDTIDLGIHKNNIELLSSSQDILSITKDRQKLGTSLLGRIQTEAMQAKEAVIDTTTKTSGHSATHTRRLGPAAKGRTNYKIGKWPSLQTQTNSDNIDTVDAKTTTNASNTRTVTRKRILGARLTSSNSQSIPNSNNPRTTRTISDSNGGRVAAKRTRNTNFKKSLGNYKIVGFTDYNFRDVALKWYHRLEDLGYNQHSLVVYDNAMADYLEGLNEERSYEMQQRNTNANANANANATILENGTTTSPSTARIEGNPYRFEKYLLPPLPKIVLRLRRDERHRKSLEMMYAHRWHYVLEQLQNGTSILMSHVDTIFNKHLNLENHSDFSNYNVLHSYESRPLLVDLEEQEQEQNVGFAIHAGMIWLQSNSQTIQFVQKIVEMCKTMCNDTMVLNELIAKTLEMEWDKEHDFETDDEFPSRTGRSKVTGHTVKVLDNHWVYSGGQKCPETNPWIVVALPHHHHHHHHEAAAAADGKKAESSSAQKLALFDTWDEGCGKQ